MILVAQIPVLYRSRQYGAGDRLPANDPAMVDAWLEAGSAVWEDEDKQTAPQPAKATPKSAPAGLPGHSSDGDPDALIGKVPPRGRGKRTK